MASLEFPDRSNNINKVNTNTSVANSSNINNDKEAQKKHKELLKQIEETKNEINKKLGIISEKTGQIADDFTEQVFGSGLLTRTLKDNIFNLSKNIKNGLINSTFKIYELYKLDAKERNKILKGYFNKIKNFVTYPFKMIFKFLKNIDKGITWISEKTVTGIGKTLKYLLIGAGVFFKWIKSFLLKSTLFKAIGSIGKLAFEGISAVFSLGGDLVKGLADKLVTSAAISSFGLGIKTLVRGLTASAFMPILAAALVGYGVFKLADFFSDRAPDPDEALSDTQKKINDLYARKAKGEISQKEFEKELEKLNTLKAGYTYMKGEQDIPTDTTNESIYKAKYEQWIKEYPEAMKDLVGANWFQRNIASGDKDKNGYLDYTPELYNRAANVIEQGNMSGFIRSQAAIEELKNKSILKNTAGVSST